MERSDLLKELRIDRDTARASGSRGRWILVAAAALLVLGGLLWFGVARSQPPTVKLGVARAASQAGGAGSVLDASGYVTARRQATVSAKITGKITEVLIEEGMRVQEGAVLARLDDTEARAQLSLALAQLVAARSQLDEVRALLAQAERDYARQDELFQKKFIAEQTLDAARAQRDSTRARLAALDQQVKVAQEGVSVAQVNLDNTVVRAPFSGVVIAKAAQPGEMISPISAGGGFTRTGIGTIVDMDSLEIQVDVNEAFINRVRPGPAGGGGAQRLSRLEDPGQRDRHHPDGGPEQGHREGAHRHQVQGPAHRAGHGRARRLPRDQRPPRPPPIPPCSSRRRPSAPTAPGASCSSTPTTRWSAAP